MTIGQQYGHRLIVNRLAASLAHEAVKAAASSPAGSPEQSFFRGVETAALHMVHPEMAAVRDGTPWLDAEDPSFRDGFLKGSTHLASVSSAPVPPTRIGLPEIDG